MTRKIMAATIGLMALAGNANAQDTRPGAVDLIDAISSGTQTAEQAVDAALGMIGDWSDLNGAAHLNTDAARAAAKAIDAGENAGPLAGLPIVVKDNIRVEGLPNAAGTPGLQDAIADTNAPVVQKLVDAGAIVVGTSNMHELAFGISGWNATYQTGTEPGVRNPYDQTRFAGGSSSGTGALVGAGAVPAGLGTDTGGSVRIPAAINGVSGLRPTMGRYPAAGIVPISRTRDTPGVIAASVADIELIDRVLTGEAPVTAAALDGLRLGIGGGFTGGLDADVSAVWQDVVSQLETAGVTFVEIDDSQLFELTAQTSFPIALMEAGPHLRDYLAENIPDKSIEDVVAAIGSADVKGTYEGLVLSSKLPAPDGSLVDGMPIYEGAMAQGRPALIAAYEAMFKDNDIDALFFPTVAQVAALASADASSIETFGAFIRNTDPGSVAALPGLSIAAGLGPDSGLPVGVELDGPSGSDRNLIAIGLAIEALLGRTPLPTQK